MNQNKIVLTKTDKCWLATNYGPYAEQVIELFGTRTIPTAFTAQAKPEDVQREIARLNPGFVVEIQK